MTGRESPGRGLLRQGISRVKSWEKLWEGREVIRITGLPAEVAELVHRHAFAGPAALALVIRRSIRGNGASEEAGHFLVEWFLHPGVAICDIVNLARATVGENAKDGAGGVVAVDLIDPSVTFVFDAGFVGEELTEQDGASRAIDARESGDFPAVGEDFVFGLAEDFPRFPPGKGRGSLIDPGTIRLGIDRGAADEEGVGFGEGKAEIPGAGEIDGLVGLRAATPGAGAMNPCSDGIGGG